MWGKIRITPFISPLDRATKVLLQVCQPINSFARIVVKTTLLVDFPKSFLKTRNRRSAYRLLHSISTLIILRIIRKSKGHYIYFVDNLKGGRKLDARRPVGHQMDSIIILLGEDCGVCGVSATGECPGGRTPSCSMRCTELGGPPGSFRSFAEFNQSTSCILPLK